METQTTHKLFIGCTEIGHIAERKGDIYNPSNLSRYIYSVTLVSSDFEGRATLVKSLHNLCKVSRSFWEFPTFYFESLEGIYSAIDALCDVVPMILTAPKAVTEIEAPIVKFEPIGEDFQNKFCDYSVPLLLEISRLVDQELDTRNYIEEEDEADYYINGTQE
jgi:hypothetical protein